MKMIVAFVVLEHVGFLVRYLILQLHKTPAILRSSAYKRLKQIQMLTKKRTGVCTQFQYIADLRALFDRHDVEQDGHLRETELLLFLAEYLKKHVSELLPYSSTIFRYMDKNNLGKVPFATCCLMLQHVNHDRFFSCLLGIYDPLNGELNALLRCIDEPQQLRRVLSEISEVHHRNSVESRASIDSIRPRDSSFFCVD